MWYLVREERKERRIDAANMDHRFPLQAYWSTA